MTEVNGQQRIIIENVQPAVEGGLYPAKRTVGERVDVTADIFCDGHDHIRAHLLYRKEGVEKWETVEMLHKMNDVWEASFVTAQKGYYEFTVLAWIDHFETWYDGFKKKAAVKVDVTVELKEGVIFLQRLLEEKDETLERAIQKLQGGYAAAVDYVTSDAFAHIVHAYPLPDHPVMPDVVWRVVAEFKKANFSAWYELFPRSASLEERHGNFKDVIKLLPRVQAMGFDVLYLPPIHPIGDVNRKGKNNNVNSAPGEPGSPWAIGNSTGGHKSIHAELGTLNDYKELIREAKKMNIDIALDIAFQCAPDHPYVGRGGLKLAHALDTFGISVDGREALDIGASTGGFTDVLLRRGATRVVALDVGYGQIDWALRNDPRVVVIERFNARHLTPADLPSSVDIVVIDVSFISLRQVFPVIPALLRPGADVVALVKPQFEAGRGEVRKGIIHDTAVHERVLTEVVAAAAAIGLMAAGSTPSPITGQKGNVEFLLHLRAS